MEKFKRKYRNNLKIYYNTNVKRVMNLSAIFLILIGVFLISNGLILKENIKPIYRYTAKKASYYETILKPNTFYENKILSQDRYYASKSIKTFAINFRYDFKADKKADIEYNYNVVAKLVGTVKSGDNQEKEIWTRDYIFYENNNKLNNNEFNISEQTNIDYEYYMNLVHSYEEEYGIAIDAVLKVRLNVNYYIDLSYFNVDNEKVEDYIELDIPITNTITTVKENYQKNVSNGIVTEENNITINELIYYIIGTLFIIGGGIVIIVHIRQNNNKIPEERYKENIRNIIKYYRNLVVTVTNEPNIKDMQIMNIAHIEDLVDVAEQNSKNIILYEVEPNKQSNLYVIVNNYMYIYKVTCAKII